MTDNQKSDIGRVTLNLSGGEAIDLLGGVEHLRKTTSGDTKRSFQSIEQKLKQSLQSES